jgi:YHS domain-containing protein
MQWLSQNWIWIVFAIGVILLVRRGGIGCGMGHGHSGHSRGEQTPSGSDHDHVHENRNSFKDAVTGEMVNQKAALTSAFQGRVYYFASKENRDRFEATPAQYSSLPSQDQADGHRHHQHGC